MLPLLERDIEFGMRDGTVLRADIYRPDTQGPHPVLLQRTPYDKTSAQQVVYQHPSWYARHGYMVVVQDTRGRYRSDGIFEPYRHEASDTADTVEWTATLPGSNGHVGMYGFSYAGAVQLLGAANRPANLTCIAPAFTSGDFYENWTYTGGALNHAFVLSWVVQMLVVPDLAKAGELDKAGRLLAAQARLPELLRYRPANRLPALVESGAAPYLAEWLAHDSRDEYWQALGMHLDRITVPCLLVGGWYDTFLEGLLDSFAAITQSGKETRLVIGPWAHTPWSRRVGNVDFGDAAGGVVDIEQLAWFDHWLKGDGPAPRPVRIFVMGANHWREESSWPLPGTSTQEWYLHSRRGAQSVSGDGRLDLTPPAEESPDVYVAIPSRPVPSAGGTASSDPAVVPMGPASQAPVEVRNDVLVFTTAPFPEELEVVGTVWLVLYAATDGADCDWNCKLIDVAPDGSTQNLCDGVVRSRFRKSRAKPELLEPNAVHRYDIRVGSTAVTFAAGHRIRLHISSSDFPQYDVNPNTGAVAAAAGPFDLRLATQTVFHDSARPSCLRIPVTRSAGGGG